MKTMSRKNALLLLTVAIVFTVAGGAEFWVMLRRAGFQAADAEVLAADAVPVVTQHLPWDRVRVRYRFTVDGTPYYGDRVRGLWLASVARHEEAEDLVSQFRVEPTQTVLYNRRDVTENILTVPGRSISMMPVVLLVAGIALLNFAIPLALPQRFPPDS